MKAIKILKKIYKNNPDIRSQRNNIDINFTIHNFNEIKEAIIELKELENRSCSNCKYVYIDTLGFNYCENPISPLSSCIFALHPSFCCNKWENKQ